MEWRNVLVVGLLSAMATACSGQEVTPEAFTADMAARFKATDPKMTVNVTSPLTITVGKDGDATIDEAACNDMKAEFVAAFKEQFSSQEPLDTTKTSRDALRLIVRDLSYCENIEKALADAKPDDKPLLAPFAPGACLILMFDFPTTRKTASPGELQQIGLTRDAAWELAKRQVLAALPKLARIKIKADSFNAFSGMPDVTSLAIDTEGWSALAAKHPGRELIVTFPDENMLTLMIAKPGVDIGKLRTLTAQNFEMAQRGVSPLVYRWTEAGWTAIN
jgi:hypothetical protein